MSDNLEIERPIRAAHCVLTGSDLRQLDRFTIQAGTPSLELMERAGEGIAELLESGTVAQGAPRLAVVLEEDRSLLVLAGNGNNGGDGCVVARVLTSLGWQVCVALVLGRPKAGSDAALCLAAWEQDGGAVLENARADEVVANWQGRLILDCVLGTGLTRAVSSELAEAFASINNSGSIVVACDIPSGLSADSGEILGEALRAEATISLGAAKQGSFLGQGPDYGGAVFVVDIDLANPADAGLESQGALLTHEWATEAFPARRRGFHKGEGGHLLIVAGSEGKSGAAHLAARAALRGGVGLVTVACPAAVAAALAATLPEAMARVLASNDQGELAEDALEQSELRLGHYDAILCGPGLGTDEGASAALEQILEQARCPVVLDADALNLVAEARQELGAILAERRDAGRGEVVWTPHPGEMARLSATSSATIQADRKGVADRFVAEHGGVLVLKGAATLVTATGFRAWNTTGNPGMATAGMGDVLGGLIAALLARGLPTQKAAALAVWWHGRAGDLLYTESRAAGFLATELADALPSVAAELLL